MASLEFLERAGGGFGVGVEPAVEGKLGGEIDEGGGEVGFEVRC